MTPSPGILMLYSANQWPGAISSSIRRGADKCSRGDLLACPSGRIRRGRERLPDSHVGRRQESCGGRDSTTLARRAVAEPDRCQNHLRQRSGCGDGQPRHSAEETKSRLSRQNVLLVCEEFSRAGPSGINNYLGYFFSKAGNQQRSSDSEVCYLEGGLEREIGLNFILGERVGSCQDKA